MSLKFAFLGAWHSHAVMHVREAAQRPDLLLPPVLRPSTGGRAL